MAEDSKFKDGAIELDFNGSGFSDASPAEDVPKPMPDGPESSPEPAGNESVAGLEASVPSLELSLVFSPTDLGASPPAQINEPTEVVASADVTAVERESDVQSFSPMEPSSPTAGEGTQGTAKHVDLSRIELMDLVSAENASPDAAQERPLEVPPPAPPPPQSDALPPMEILQEPPPETGGEVAPTPLKPADPLSETEITPSTPASGENEAGATADNAAEAESEGDEIQVALPEPTNVGAVPAPRSNARRRAWVLAGAAAVAAGLFLAVFGMPLLDEFMGGGDSVIEAPAGPIEPSVKAPEKVAKNQAAHKSKGSKASEKLSAAPLPQPTPSKSFATSKNRDYFFEIDQAIIAGNPVGAVRAFKKPMPGGLNPEEKVIAAEFEARYYLLVGKPARAMDALAPYCQSAEPSHATACVHYLRSLVSMQKFDEASAFLGKTRGVQGWEHYRPILSVCEFALKALSLPNQESVRNLMMHALAELNVGAEWYRQRTLWTVRALYAMSRSDRANLLRFFLASKRDALISGIRNAEAAGVSLSDPLFVSAINHFGIQFELKPLSGVGGKGKQDSEYNLVATAFALSARAPFESLNLIASSASGFSSNASFSEISRLIAAQMALNEGNVQFAWGIYTQEFPNLKSKRSRFLYEWTLVFARCVSEGMGTGSLAQALEGVITSLNADSLGKNDFFHWLTVAKLERVARKKRSNALEKAMALAVTPHEKAIVGVEEARMLAALGKPREAAASIRKWANQIPDDGLLLQAAAEMAPLGNYDPSPYLDAQVQASSKYPARNVEYPLFSESTLRKLIVGL